MLINQYYCLKILFLCTKIFFGLYNLRTLCQKFLKFQFISLDRRSYDKFGVMAA